ncbi:MAG: N-acetyltransferase [Muribaculaceae bacterium]|nr:N-acetyltransferase [Muribaculaceae bacterium]
MPYPKSAIIDPLARIGKDTKIDEFTYIGPHASIGTNCKIHRGVQIHGGAIIGNCVKIQDNAVIPEGVVISDGAFIGPSVTFTNDRYPRAINIDGTLKTSSDWKLSSTHIGYGASICANATIVCGVTIGSWAMVAAGAVVTHDVPERCMVAGVPARIIRVDIPQ